MHNINPVKNMVITDDQLKVLVLKNKLVDEKGLYRILQYAKDSGVSLADALCENNLVTDENLGLLISDFLKLPQGRNGLPLRR